MVNLGRALFPAERPGPGDRFRNPCGDSSGGQRQLLFVCGSGIGPRWRSPHVHVDGQRASGDRRLRIVFLYTSASRERGRNLYGHGCRDRWVTRYSSTSWTINVAAYKSPRVLFDDSHRKGRHRPSHCRPHQPGKPDCVVPDEYPVAQAVRPTSGVPARRSDRSPLRLSATPTCWCSVRRRKRSPHPKSRRSRPLWRVAAA